MEMIDLDESYTVDQEYVVIANDRSVEEDLAAHYARQEDASFLSYYEVYA